MLIKPNKIIPLVLIFLLIFEQSGFAQVSAQLDLSGYISGLKSTLIQDKYRPLHLRYLGYDAKSNDFKLLLDKGDFVKEVDSRQKTVDREKENCLQTTNYSLLNQETKKLMEYFFIGLSLPNESFWVNLRPDSPDNIIDSELTKTDIGKILLEADVQLKKDTALWTSPQTTEGKKYWDKLYKKAEELYGYDNITIPTLTRPWIVPGEVIIRETSDEGRGTMPSAYIYKATLKVMLEEDYLKVNSRQQTVVRGKEYEFNDLRAKELNTYSTQLIKELIIPKLTKEINTSRKYAKLRQVYYSLILAQWFKKRRTMNDGRWEIGTKNLAGLTSKTPWSKDTYYQKYQKSFKDGEYSLKEPVRTPFGRTIRSYFSGGISFDTNAISSAITLRVTANPDRDITNVFTGSGINNYFISASFGAGKLELTVPQIISTIEPAAISSSMGKEDVTQVGEDFSSMGKVSTSIDNIKTNRRGFLKILGGTLAGVLLTDNTSSKQLIPENKVNKKQIRDFVRAQLAPESKLKDIIPGGRYAKFDKLIKDYPKRIIAGKEVYIVPVNDFYKDTGSKLYIDTSFTPELYRKGSLVAFVDVDDYRRLGDSWVDKEVGNWISGKKKEGIKWWLKTGGAFITIIGITIGAFVLWVESNNIKDFIEERWNLYSLNKVVDSLRKSLIKSIVFEEGDAVIDIEKNSEFRRIKIEKRQEKIQVFTYRGDIKEFPLSLNDPVSKIILSRLIDGISSRLLNKPQQEIWSRLKGSFYTIIDLFLSLRLLSFISQYQNINAVTIEDLLIEFLCWDKYSSSIGGTSNIGPFVGRILLSIPNAPQARIYALLLTDEHQLEQEYQQNPQQLFPYLLKAGKSMFPLGPKSASEWYLSDKAANILISLKSPEGRLFLFDYFILTRNFDSTSFIRYFYDISVKEFVSTDSQVSYQWHHPLSIKLYNAIKEQTDINIHKEQLISDLIDVYYSQKWTLEIPLFLSSWLVCIQDMSSDWHRLHLPSLLAILLAGLDAERPVKERVLILDAICYLVKQDNNKYAHFTPDQFEKFLQNIISITSDNMDLFQKNFAQAIQILISNNPLLSVILENFLAEVSSAKKIVWIASELLLAFSKKQIEDLGAEIEILSRILNEAAPRITKTISFIKTLNWKYQPAKWKDYVSLVNQDGMLEFIIEIIPYGYAFNIEHVSVFPGLLVNKQNLISDIVKIRKGFSRFRYAISVTSANEFITDPYKLAIEQIASDPHSFYDTKNNLSAIFEAKNPELAPYINETKDIFSGLQDNTFLSGLIEEVFKGTLNKSIIYSYGNKYRFVKNFFLSDEITAELKIKFIDSLSDSIVAKSLNINIKIARFLKDKKDNLEFHLRRLKDTEFKDKINKIAYNLNREVTSHPAERRLGEDEKTILFSLLFSDAVKIGAAKEIFDEYFLNAPEQYNIDIPALNELLDYVSITELRKIIHGIMDNPKQSLDEITQVVKQHIHGQPNAEFIIRRLNWITSNLFVLQDKLEQLELVSQALEKAGKTIEDLRAVLSQIDKAGSFFELITLAKTSNFSAGDVLRLKLESVSRVNRENLIADGIQAMDLLTSEEITEGIYEELLIQFDYQPSNSQKRIYFKLLLSTQTDNTLLAKTIGELKQVDAINGYKKAFFKRQFFIKYRDLIKEDHLWDEFLTEAEALPSEKQKEAFKQVRKLYQDRRYVVNKNGLDRVSEIIYSLNLEIALSLPRTQIPHAFYESLLRLNPNRQGFETIRQLIEVMNANRSMTDQLAGLKNRLNDKIIDFANSIFAQKSRVFAGILETVRQHSLISIEHLADIYNDLVFYLEQYLQVMDIYQRAKDNLLVGLIKQDIEEKSRIILADIIDKQRINRKEMDELAEKLSLIHSDVLVAQFKTKLKITNESGLIKKLNKYAAYNSRFKWTDHEGRNIYQLISLYLKTIKDKEIYEYILAALEAEIEGRFPEFKYRSQDYMKTIDEIILIEAAKLPKTELDRFNQEKEKTKGDTLYEKLEYMRGFEIIKDRIKKIKEHWEKNIIVTLSNRNNAEFTDDFYVLFNIGNSRYFSACQSCTYGNDLNRGLTGYVVNGTNKTVVSLDEFRRPVTRRIVRLKVIGDKQGNKQPAIFIEEKTQFGSREIDTLYDLLDEVSEGAGILQISSQTAPAQTIKVLAGKKDDFLIYLFQGRSKFDYSDLYGSSVQGKINTGLYCQKEAEIKTKVFDLLVKPKASKEKDNISSSIEMSADSFKSIAMSEKSASPLIIERSQEDIGGIDGSTSSPLIPEVKEDVGGINFQTIPIITHPVISPVGNFRASSSLKNTIFRNGERKLDCPNKSGNDSDGEWLQIQKMVKAEIIPSTERIKEYLVSSCLRDADFNEQLNKVICCIAAVGRMEEERGEPAKPEFKQLLSLVESEQSADELRLALTRIIIHEKGRK